STIRESLAVLVADGVAIRVPNSGVAVKELSASDVSDVSLARVALESSGVRRWPAASASRRAAVRAAVELAHHLIAAEVSLHAAVGHGTIDP
ncbi:MAG: hypothetical protein M3O94_09920, partial [Actinomycetota bacterium]|nr:hypothetical protein [Actinomycetota bacterium]